MNYSININQKAAVDNKWDVDIIDLSMLDVFRIYAPKKKCEKIFDEAGVWYWVSYGIIVKALPLSGLKTKDAVYRRMKKLEAAGLIVFNPKNQLLGRSYFQFGDAYDLYTAESDAKSDEDDQDVLPTDQKPEGVRMKPRTPTDETPNPYGSKTEPPTDQKPDYYNTNNHCTNDCTNDCTKGEKMQHSNSQIATTQPTSATSLQQSWQADTNSIPNSLLSKWAELTDDEQSRAALCYHLSKGAWQTIKASSLTDCFALRSPSVGAVAHYVGERDAVQMVAEIIANAAALVNVGKNIQAPQIYPTAALIVSMPEFRLFSVADFRLAINRGVTGQYGKLYDSFDITTICAWLNQYWSERMDFAENAATMAMVEQTQNDKFMPDWFSEYLRESKAKQIRIENERREIQARADEFVKAWEDEIFETELVEGFPVRSYRPGGVERVLKRAIFGHVSFRNAANARQLYCQLEADGFRW